MRSERTGTAHEPRGRGVLIVLAALCCLAPVPARAAGQAGMTPRPAVAVRSSTTQPVVDDASLSRLEQSAIDGVNKERLEAGLPPLVLSPDLCRIARAYSRDMVERKYFSHQDPDGHMVDVRTSSAGIMWRNVGENIARNRGFKDPAEVAVREWMKSEGHRENILDNKYRETGVGVWIAPDRTVYFTQIFLTRSKSSSQ